MELIAGALVSIIVEWLKSKSDLGGYKTLAILVFISLVAATVYTYLVYAGYWSTVANIIVSAGAFYTFIIARFK